MFDGDATKFKLAQSKVLPWIRDKRFFFHLKMGIEVVCADVPSPVETESKLHLVFTNNLLFITRDYLHFLGDQSSRTLYYKKFLTKILNEKRVKTVHDMACGTGIDSVMLLEEGFKVYYHKIRNRVL